MSLYTYRIIDADETSCVCSIHLNESHEVFRGHFPETSILPGVYYLELISEILQQQHSEKITFKSASNIKFLAPILPQSTPSFELSIQWKEENTTLTINAIAQKDNVIFSKLKCLYEFN